MFRRLSRIAALCALAAVAACGSRSSGLSGPAQTLYVPESSLSSLLNAPSLQTPALLTVNYRYGTVESWPIRAHGGHNPQRISKPLGVGSPSGMVADGHVVTVASQYPPGIVRYDIDTGMKSVTADPYGTPGDLAIDKSRNVYAITYAKPIGNVTEFPVSGQPKKLSCKYMSVGEGIAVDNEGDIFVNALLANNGTGVVEIPTGPNGPQPQNCKTLALKPENGYAAGLTLDPKTDDLIVLDDPDLCAGGVEGRMTIYPKPYSKATGRSHDLGANCAGGIRLDANSTTVFVGDQDVSGSFGFILQRSYPDGRNMGTYFGGDSSGFTTIPNTLPN